MLRHGRIAFAVIICDILCKKCVEYAVYPRKAGMASLACLGRAIDGAEETLAAVLHKARVRSHANKFPLNERQRLILGRLLDNFSDKVTSSEYAKLAKVSQDTAIRDIKELVAHGILKQSEGGGRSTAYAIVVT